MHISIYYIYIYTCGIWRTFLLYKVLIGWLECLRIIVREEFQCFEFPFPPETNARPHDSGAFGTKDCMIFLLKKTKKKVKATEREKDVSELHRLFLIMLSKILCWESPHHSHMTITADLMHETCFSDVQLLVWISCCFLKWYRSLRDFSSGPLLSTPGLCVDAIAPRVDANLCSFFYSSSSVDHACSGEEGSLRLQLNAEYCRYMILSWIILWFLRVSEHISARALLA